MKILKFLLLSFLLIGSSNSFSMDQVNTNNEVLKSGLRGFALGAANWYAFKCGNDTTKVISLLLTGLNFYQISFKNEKKPITQCIKEILANIGSMSLVFELCAPITKGVNDTLWKKIKFPLSLIVPSLCLPNLNL